MKKIIFFIFYFVLFEALAASFQRRCEFFSKGNYQKKVSEGVVEEKCFCGDIEYNKPNKYFCFNNELTSLTGFQSKIVRNCLLGKAEVVSRDNDFQCECNGAVFNPIENTCVNGEVYVGFCPENLSLNENFEWIDKTTDQGESGLCSYHAAMNTISTCLYQNILEQEESSQLPVRTFGRDFSLKNIPDENQFISQYQIGDYFISPMVLAFDYNFNAIYNSSYRKQDYDESRARFEEIEYNISSDVISHIAAHGVCMNTRPISSDDIKSFRWLMEFLSFNQGSSDEDFTRRFCDLNLSVMNLEDLDRAKFLEIALRVRNDEEMKNQIDFLRHFSEIMFCEKRIKLNSCLAPFNDFSVKAFGPEVGFAGFHGALRQSLSQNPPFGMPISFCSGVMAKDKPTTNEREFNQNCGPHDAMVLGVRQNHETKTCQYQVKDNQGSRCPPFRENLHGSCENGVYWVDQIQLFNESLSIGVTNYSEYR